MFRRAFARTPRTALVAGLSLALLIATPSFAHAEVGDDSDVSTLVSPTATPPASEGDASIFELQSATFDPQPTPVINGTVRVDSPLTVDIGAWDQAATHDIAWQVGGRTVSTAGEYSPRSGDVGSTLVVLVTAWADGYDSVTVTSQPATVAPATFTSSPRVSITGSARVGQTLTASSSASVPAATLTYEWRADDVVIGSGASLALTPAHLGKRITVVASATRAGYTTATHTSAAVTVAAGTFTTKPKPAIAGTVRVGQKLTAGGTAFAPSAALAYAWKIDGKTVSTGSTFTPTAEHRGKALVLTITASKSGFTTVTQSTSKVTVAAGAFTTKPKPSISGTVRVGQKLTAGGTGFAPAANLAYAWKIDGKTVSTSSTFTPAGEHRGKSLVLTITASKSGFTSVTQSTSKVTVAAGAFTTKPKPSIAGTIRVGQKLTAGGTGFTPAAKVAYAWKVDGKTVSTASTFTPSAAHQGKKLTLTVTAAKTGFASITQSTGSATVAKGAFASAPVPTIAGSAAVGGKLTAKVGTWSPAATTLTYQWQRNGVDISGATKASYTLTGADQGKTISVTVTGKRSNVTTASSTSATTAKIEAPKPVITQPGTYIVGSEIKPGTYVANASYGCYWERRSTAGNSFSGIITNEFVDYPGRMIVTISPSDRYFQTNEDCGNWTPYTASGSPKTSFGDGVHAVGVHIKPGVYRSQTPATSCYWEIVSGFGGSFAEIIDNEFTYDSTVVQIYRDDLGMVSEGCGTWTRISG